MRGVGRVVWRVEVFTGAPPAGKSGKKIGPEEREKEVGSRGPGRMAAALEAMARAVVRGADRRLGAPSGGPAVPMAWAGFGTV